MRSFHGGYLKSKSVKFLLMIAFSWLKLSKENFPWYLPKPLRPMPPKGKVSQANCKCNNESNQSLMYRDKARGIVEGARYCNLKTIILKFKKLDSDLNGH